MRRDANTRNGYDRATIDAVLDALAPYLRASRRTTIVGISGLQGSGKTTLARQLARTATARGMPSIVLSLDDFYLGRRERAKLARDLHPLLATRGVPGTHDPALIEQTLDAIAHATARRPARIPRFDKGRDTRVAPSRWRRIAEAPRLILLEGWCVGVPAQGSRTLAKPLNALERVEDANGCWRAHIDAQLAGNYARLWRRLDALVVLAAPDFDIVERWRGEPERALRRRGAPRAMSPPELKRFLMHYERISKHALRTLPTLADVVIALDASRNVRSVRTSDPRGSLTARRRLLRNPRLRPAASRARTDRC
jgi:D-glycerate 3-kinase